MMKEITTLSILLCLGATLAWGQSGVAVQKCKTCNKPLRECPYKGKHPARQATSQPKQSAFLRVNGSSNDINTNCTNASGCTFVYTVATSASDYTLSSSNAWITFMDKKQESFRVEIEPNRLTRIREGYFTITADGKQVKVNIKQVGTTPQRATYLLLDGSPDDQVINCDDPDGCTAQYAISTDTADFSVTGLPLWIKLTQKSLTSFSVKIEPNPKHSERNDFFWVKAGGKQVKVKVRQVRKPKKGISGASNVRLDVGAGMRVSHTNVSFNGPTVGGVINYGVNNLNDAGTPPDFSSGVGFEAHGNVGFPVAGGLSISTGLGLSIHNFSNQFSSDEWRYTLDNWSTGYSVKQVSKEKYRFTMLDIPLMAEYSLPVGSTDVVLSFKGGFVFGIGLGAKVKVNGQIHADKQNSSGTNTGQYYESQISGSANLYTGSYQFTQTYTAGSSRTYNINNKAGNPFNRFNLSLRIGTDLEVGRFLFGLGYDIGLTNIANQNYFTNVSTQIPGFFHLGSPEFRSSTLPLKNYKQRIGSFVFTVGYRF